MSGEIINLNRARKTRAKLARVADADANRVRFGRTRAERKAQDTEVGRREAVLDGAKRTD